MKFSVAEGGLLAWLTKAGMCMCLYWPKVQQAEAWRRKLKLNYRIGVDGGINFHTASDCARAGADTFISGTGLFGEPSLARAVEKMRRIVTRCSPLAATGATPAAATKNSGKQGNLKLA